MSLHDPEIRRELEMAVAEAVSRFGMAGEVLVEGTKLRLVGAGPEVSTEIGPVGDQWPTLAPELRARRATELARRLVAARREALGPAPTARRQGLPSFVAPLVVLALGGGVIYFAYQKLAPGALHAPVKSAPGPTEPRNVEEYEKARVERAARVCEATRSRIQRGASIGPTDVEGWVVELALVSVGSDPLKDPALGEFLGAFPDGGGRRFVWTGVPALAALEGVDTEVELAPEPFASRDANVHGARFTFTGKYVVPYFSPEERRDYVKLAGAMGEKLHASYGALYARCAGGATHHLGAWFLGPDPGSATASLIYWLGGFNDPPQIRESVLFPDGGSDVRASGAFDRIRDQTKGFDRKKVRDLLSENGGMIAGGAGVPAALTFPFADSNRAARASLSVARVAGVGLER